MKKIYLLKKILRYDDGKFVTAEIDEDSVQEFMTELESSYECFRTPKETLGWVIN